MKATRAIRMEFEPKDKPFDAYEAEKEAGGSAVEVALKVGKACAAVRDDC